jgi:integrase
VSLKRDRSGNMILRFRTGGRGSKHEYRNLGPITHDEAKDRAAEIQDEARRRRGLSEPGTTFADLAKTWTELAGPGLAAATNSSSESMLRLHILPVLGSIRVGDLKPVTIDRYRADRLASKRPPARSTLNLELRLILWILNFGEKKSIVRNPIPRGTVGLDKLDPKTIYFQPDAWAAFLEAADSDPELRKAAQLWRLKLLTASRISEMIDLQWSAVDFERGSIAIGQRKTGRTKTLTLTPAMRAVLAAVPRGIGEAPVFAYEGLPWRASRLRHHFERTVGSPGPRGRLDDPQHPPHGRHVGAEGERPARPRRRAPRARRPGARAAVRPLFRGGPEPGARRRRRDGKPWR